MSRGGKRKRQKTHIVQYKRKTRYKGTCCSPPRSTKPIKNKPPLASPTHLYRMRFTEMRDATAHILCIIHIHIEFSVSNNLRWSGTSTRLVNNPVFTANRIYMYQNQTQNQLTVCIHWNYWMTSRARGVARTNLLIIVSDLSNHHTTTRISNFI